jgi:NADH dehydrogenase FAD-containing subunit
MNRPRVVVAGLGDTGLLTAIHLSRRCAVVGISPKPGLVSGQELGNRISRPESWARDYWISFDRYRRLDRVRVLHAVLVGADLDARTVTVTDAQGRTHGEEYDVLVIATGVRNGFWRTPDLETADQVGRALRDVHDRVGAAGSVAVVGGGAAAVSAAGNIARTWPDKAVDLYFPGGRALPQHHPRVWARVERELRARGVGLHPGHRADVPAEAACDRITTGPVRWSTGQPPTDAEAVVWAIGRVHPNTAWLPRTVLDDHGFVEVGPDLRVVGHPEVFAIGDVAATDPLRSSARNRADKLLARNVLAHLRGKTLGAYRPPRRRWGSVLGIQEDGLRVFAPAGWSFRFPGWTIRVVLEGLIVRWGIYRGVRARPESVVPLPRHLERTIWR